MNALLSIVLPPEMAVGPGLMLLGASVVASLVTVVAGIGGGGILLALMAGIVPPAALIPVHGAIQLGSNFFRSLLLLRHMVWTVFPAFALGTIIGAGAGGLVAVNLPPAWVQIGVGAFILFTLVGRAPQWLRHSGVVTGLISSFLTMFFGATGLFVAGFTKAQDLPRHAHVALHGTLMTLQHGVKVVSFGMLGFAFGPWLPFLAAMILCGIVGTFIGRHLLGLVSETLFRFLLNAVLALLALRLIWSGVTGL